MAQAEEEASPADADGDVEMTDEAILQQALAMSLAEAGGAPPGPEAANPNPSTPAPTKEEEKTPKAPTKAAQDGGQGGSSQAATPGQGLGAMLEDKSFVTSVLSNLPGVDVSDANVQQVLSALKEKQSPKRSREEDEEEEEEGKE